MAKGQKSSTSTQSNEYVEPSNNSIYQRWGGWHKFMLSHGLKPWNLDDVEEGKQILQGFKDIHRQEWEERQNE